MKTYKTAKSILSHALEDIEGGQWCKKSLAQYGTCKIENKSRVLADSGAAFNGSTWVGGLEDAKDVSLFDRPMGCALGLVSMYSGIGREQTVVLPNGKKVKFFEPEYPDGTEHPSVRKAMIALADAIPSTKESFDDEDSWDINEAIVTYNDKPHMNQARAAKWFRKALESVS